MKIKLHWGAIIFALLWAFAAFLPPVREVSRALFTLWGPLESNPYYRNSGSLPWKSDDPIILVWNFERHYADEKALEEWDALIARYPDQTWIAAARLRATLLSGLNPPYQQFPPREKTAYLTKRAQTALRVAQQEATREPDNAFWPWMETILHFALKQQEQTRLHFDIKQREQAVAALERASKAQHFNDYLQSVQQARFDWLRQHDNPTWEERMAVFYQRRDNYAYRIQDINSEVARMAMGARSRGDNARAIRITAALLGANAVIERDSDSYILTRFAEISWINALSTLFGRKFKPSVYQISNNADHEAAYQSYIRRLNQEWTDYARKNGRGDVANQTQWIFKTPIYSSKEMRWSTAGLQLNRPVLRGAAAQGAPLILLVASGVCFSFALLWLLGRLALLWQTDNAVPTRAEVTTSVNFSFWALVGCGVFIGAVITLLQLSSYQLGIPSSFGALLYGISPLQLAATCTVAIGCWLLPISLANWKRHHRVYRVNREGEAKALGRNLGRARTLCWLVFLICVVLVASNGNGAWDNTPLRVPVTGTLAFVWLISGFVLEAIRFRRTGWMLPRIQVEDISLHPTSPGERAWKWARNGAWLIALVGFYTALWGTDWQWRAPFLLLGISVAAIGTIVALGLGFKTPNRDSFFLRLATQSAGALSIVCSFSFLLLALAVWPLRAELNHQLDRRLAMKDRDWLKEQSANYR